MFWIYTFLHLHSHTELIQNNTIFKNKSAANQLKKYSIYQHSESPIVPSTTRQNAQLSLVYALQSIYKSAKEYTLLLS